jgi:hypothetical protein
MFARVKYCEITEVTIATLFARVFVMRHQMSCCRFLCLSSGSLCGLLETHRIPSTFVASYQPTQWYQSSSIITMMKSSWDFMGSYSAFKEHSASGQRDNLDQVHSYQMIFKKIWWRRLVQ